MWTTTTKEKATIKDDIARRLAGRFRFEGVEHRGAVNRSNQTATALVDDRKGDRYCGGKHSTMYLCAGAVAGGDGMSMTLPRL